MTNPDEIGSAEIRIEPDFTGFAEELRRALAASLTAETARASRAATTALTAAARAQTATVRAAAQVQVATVKAGAQEQAAAHATVTAQVRAESAKQTATIAAAARVQAAQVAASARIRIAAEREAAAAARLGAAGGGGGGGIGVLDSNLKNLTGTIRSLPLSILTGGFQAVAVAATAASAAVLGLGIAIAKIGLDTASNLQNIELGIRGLGDQLGDVSVAGVISQLRDLSVTAGVSIGELGRLEQGFVALGISGQDSINLIKIQLGALAATGNLSEEAIHGTSRALQQIASKPFLQLEELNQIADSGLTAVTRIKVAQQIAANTGDKLVDVQERFRLGTQQSGDALTAVVQVMKNLDKEGNAVERRLQTFSGAFDSAKQKANLALGDLFKPLGTSLAAEINKLDINSLVQKIGGPISGALEEVVPQVIAALPDIVEGLAFTFTTLAPLIGKAASAAASLAAAFVDHKDDINSVIESFSDFLGGLEALHLENILGPLLNQVGLAITLLGYFGEALQFLEPIFEPLSSAMGHIFTPFITGIDLVLHSLEQLLEAFGLIPSKIPVFGGIADDADAAAQQVHALREQILGIDGTVVTAKIQIQVFDIQGQASQYDVGEGGDALAPALGLNQELLRQQKAIEDSLKANLPKFPNTGVSAPDKGAASAAKAAAAAQARAVAAVKKALREIQDETGKQTINQLQANFDQLAAGLKDAGLKEYVKQVRNTEKVLVRLAKTRDQLNDQLKDSVQNLQSLKDESDSFADSIRNSVNALGNVAQATKGIRQTFVGIRQALVHAVGTTARFATVIEQLKAAGLNEVSLRQIVEAGPEQGLDSGRALLSGGAGGIAIINDLQKQLGTQADTLATNMQTLFYDAGIKAAEGIVTGLQSQEAAIEAQMNRIADKMAKAIRKALQIKSPSARLFREVGVPAGQGIVNGLMSEVSRAGGQRAGNSISNYASSINFGPGSIVAHGATEAGASRMGTGLGMGITAVLERQAAQAVLNGTG